MAVSMTQIPAPAVSAAPLARDDASPDSTQPRVGVIYNPRSHGNRGADFDCEVCPDVHIAKPGDREQLERALGEFAQRGIDLLVINGGDGTVRDVLTSGFGVFGGDWPAIAVLPKGKTNALTIDLGIPAGWGLQDAISAFEAGHRAKRRPMAVRDLSAASIAPRLAFILGAGAFATATKAGQKAHRLGAFNSAVVAVTGLWALAQSLFATRENPWRRGARMDIKLGGERAAMSHSQRGDPAFRQILFASTLENFPAGIRPFGALRSGLKLLAVDQISRTTTAMVPAVLAGKLTQGLGERGIHQQTVSRFQLEIDEAVVLDGEAYGPGCYNVSQGPMLDFVVPDSPPTP